MRWRSSCQVKARAGNGSFNIRVRLSPAIPLMLLGL